MPPPIELQYNTYGIEIEFGTHDSQALSFTHIEVCYLYPYGAQHDQGWKIETDADYTLELVSPILQFEREREAVDFRDNLMRQLEMLVRTGIRLEDLMNRLNEFISVRFVFGNGIWQYQNNAHPLNLGIRWIGSRDLANALIWENWDEDTDLERVLAFRRITIEEIAQGEGAADLLTQARMKNVIVTKSRKHGGLPSSQLNLPMHLLNFTAYETGNKRNKAWDRLLETEITSAEYIDGKLNELRQMYPQLAENPVWAAKYLNKDYIESQIDEKIPIWHRYWLWLETFYISAGCMTLGTDQRNQFLREYPAWVNEITDSAYYYSVGEAKQILRNREIMNSNFFNLIRYDRDIGADIIYLAVHKQTAGALSELSESLQKQAQEKIMTIRGEWSMEQIMNAIPDNQFMQFHFALKDLTSLWFKASLFETISTEERNPDQRDHVLRAKARLLQIGPEQITSIITTMLESNLKLLGWYFSVREANNQEFDYEWEEFCAYNMPSIPAFRNSLRASSQQLNDNLQNLNPTILATLNQLPQNNVIFLKRNYTNQENPAQQVPNASVAKWEGRWDTMKAPIRFNDQLYTYLVEHRNN